MGIGDGFEQYETVYVPSLLVMDRDCGSAEMEELPDGDCDFCCVVDGRDCGAADRGEQARSQAINRNNAADRVQTFGE
jgi:hypothetical protein